MHRAGRPPRVRPGRYLGGRRDLAGGPDPDHPEALRDFADSLCATDEVALEATGNTYAIARLLEGHVGRVVVSNPQKTRAIAEAKVKTDKVDAAVLAGLLAANYLPAVWLPDDQTHALRRQVTRPANIVRQRTRLKNQVQSILHRNLIGRCPAADLFGTKGRAWLATQDLPQTSTRQSGHCCADSTSTAKSCASSTPNSAGSASSAPRSAGS